MYEFFLAVVDLVHGFGYLGIFVMTFVESTFVPIPAEITLIPAGFLVHKGEMNLYIVLLISTIGTLCGCLCNYYIAYHVGRKLLMQYGKYLFVDDKRLLGIEKFFNKYGKMSVFFGRLLPGVKHFISFPAGLAKMKIKQFTIYSAAGGAIWCTVLILLGKVIGENEKLIVQYLKQINFIIVLIVSVLIATYIWKKSVKNK